MALESVRMVGAIFAAIAGTAAAAASEGGPLPTINLLETDKISIFAEKSGQRQYAERFAESVYEAAYETTGESAGKGLVIIGNFDDPHPILLIKKYIDIAESSGAAVEGSFFGGMLEKAIDKWEEADEEMQKEIGMDIESVAYVIPMPLEPAMLNLYLTAREVEFDEAEIEKRFGELEPGALRFGDFERFDWVIYLPPKNAIDQVIKDVLPHAMEKEKLGFFKRTLVRGAVFTFKPVIRDAMEGFRKSLLYGAILRATSDFTDEDIDLLTEAYLGSLMPRGNVVPGKKKDRSLEAIREQLEENRAYAADPSARPESVIPDDPELASRYVGDYADPQGRQYSIFQKEGVLHY